MPSTHSTFPNLYDCLYSRLSRSRFFCTSTGPMDMASAHRSGRRDSRWSADQNRRASAWAQDSDQRTFEVCQVSRTPAMAANAQIKATSDRQYIRTISALTGHEKDSPFIKCSLSVPPIFRVAHTSRYANTAPDTPGSSSALAYTPSSPNCSTTPRAVAWWSRTIVPLTASHSPTLSAGGEKSQNRSPSRASSAARAADPYWQKTTSA